MLHQLGLMHPGESLITAMFMQKKACFVISSTLARVYTLRWMVVHTAAFDNGGYRAMALF